MLHKQCPMHFLGSFSLPVALLSSETVLDLVEMILLCFKCFNNLDVTVWFMADRSRPPSCISRLCAFSFLRTPFAAALLNVCLCCCGKTRQSCFKMPSGPDLIYTLEWMDLFWQSLFESKSLSYSCCYFRSKPLHSVTRKDRNVLKFVTRM